jgi:hypothetical protein
MRQDQIYQGMQSAARETWAAVGACVSDAPEIEYAMARLYRESDFHLEGDMPSESCTLQGGNPAGICFLTLKRDTIV